MFRRIGSYLKPENTYGLQAKIVRMSVILLVAVTVLLTSVSSIVSYFSTLGTVQTFLMESATLGSSDLKHYVEGEITIVEEFAASDFFVRENHTLEEKKRILKEFAQRNGYNDAWYADKTGLATNTRNISDRAYFKVCQSTMKVCISDMLVSKDNNALALMLVAPVIINGKFEGVIIASMEGVALSNIIKSIKIGETSEAFVVDSKGTYIAHNRDGALVMNETNHIKAVAAGDGNTGLADIETLMIKGEKGYGNYREGSFKMLGYAPVGVNGWSLAVAVEPLEYLASAIYSVIGLILLAAGVILFGIKHSKKTAQEIVEPLQVCAKRMTLLSKGDLHSEFPRISTNDEVEEMARSARGVIDTLQVIIGDVDYILGEMAKGNFNVRTKGEEQYVGDFKAVLLSIRNININLTKTLYEINEASNQVEMGSMRILDGANALTDSAMSQASSIEELHATVTDVLSEVDNNAKNASQANSLADDVGDGIEQSNGKMKSMVEAMHEIRDSSTQISNIIKAINDIAAQTNLLALNASIEAARAGEAGRGFAVVADQVGKLAAESSQAAKNSSELIANSVRAVENGMKIADETALRLNESVQRTNDLVKGISKISEASVRQAESLEQISKAVEEISEVVEKNSAMAEESSRSSDDMMGQAKGLKTLVDKFTLRKNHDI